MKNWVRLYVNNLKKSLENSKIPSIMSFEKSDEDIKAYNTEFLIALMSMQPDFFTNNFSVAETRVIMREKESFTPKMTATLVVCRGAFGHISVCSPSEKVRQKFFYGKLQKLYNFTYNGRSMFLVTITDPYLCVGRKDPYLCVGSIDDGQTIHIDTYGKYGLRYFIGDIFKLLKRQWSLSKYFLRRGILAEL